MATTTKNFISYLRVDGFPPETFEIIHWSCREALAELSVLTVVAHAPLGIDTAALVRRNAQLVVVDGEDRNGAEYDPSHLTEIPAMITEATIDVVGPSSRRCNVMLTLRSRLWAATLVTASRVFLDLTVREIITRVLEGNGFVEGNDFEFKLKETYEPYEYTVQYQETDFDFISRLMEDEGIYYYMSDRPLKSGQKGELKDYLILLDTIDFHPEKKVTLGDDGIDVPFRPANASNPGGRAIGALSLTHRVLPKEVLLKDYNYRKPTLELKGVATADPAGFGTCYSYGDHFKTPDEGNALAKIRAEEILCRVRTWNATSCAMGLEPGVIFNLIDHPITAWNGRYIVTAISHTGYQPGAGLAPPHSSDDVGYMNTFTAIRAETQWRPQRVTPKPRLDGVMHATVDGPSSGDYADLDDMGRYKVKLPFDLSGEQDGKASRYIRKSQPYSGPDYGMHFPLHKGTEVLLVHQDGDPDRPIIVGAVPNPDTTSPVTGRNNTQCILNTGGGNRLVIEDSTGGQRIALSSPTAGTFITIGAPPG